MLSTAHRPEDIDWGTSTLEDTANGTTPLSEEVRTLFLELFLVNTRVDHDASQTTTRMDLILGSFVWCVAIAEKNLATLNFVASLVAALR